MVVSSSLPPRPDLNVLHPGLSHHGAAGPGLGPGQQHSFQTAPGGTVAAKEELLLF